ncbi:MAG TPA: purine-nucleoside phosphorylase [Peptostreptococcaceae bacterium]|nr:purine-nucleoside phosphorylase [Peptostreptococcaceae bacterium]
MNNLFEKIQESAKYIQSKTNIKPQIGLILGSGLGVLGDEVENPTIIKYNEIPNFPVSTVEGHAGQLVIGKLEKKDVVVMQGRFHFYEGYPMQDVTFPVRVMKALGVDTIIVTNAAGGSNESFTPGDLMIITDHINFGGNNPLIGPNDNRLGVRFPDMSKAYTPELIDIARNAANELGINVKEGVYMFLTGPTYETPAEIKMAQKLGADAVGMSTVPEVIVASHSQLKVLGISCITNMAAGILNQPLNHEEVIETTQKVQNEFLSLVKTTIKNM